MRRTQIYLSAELDAALTRLSEASGLTRSELIRQAVERTYLGTLTQASVLRSLDASAGAWRRRESGAAYVERMRRGRLARLHAADSEA